ncbi:MAG: carbohydrate ABC transporter permease [Sphaerochaetaceae bacterium]|nr:carbohydrate ABC transporter permease [Sphaerochaetaceae bacterium]MDC7249955.1 carbohydrate ABC transporter permease [Sphaerochaetaceae bacterium]
MVNNKIVKFQKVHVSRILMNIFVFLSSLSCIFPIIWLFYSSLKTQGEFDINNFALPKSPTFQNYLHVLTTSDMPRYMLNSIFVTSLSLLFILFFAFVVGYFISRFKFKGRNILFSLFMLGMLVPVHSLMVPLYVIFSRLNLVNHYYTLVIPYFAFQLPVGIYLAESYIHSIPKEMEEASCIDGASFSLTLFKIILPMCKPILTTIIIISFFYCWNEFSFALILTTGVNMRTVPLGLALFSGSFTTNYPILMAAMIISTLPTLILYSLFSNKIMDGMVSGAIKG